MNAPIFVFSGPPAAGKSTVATALLHHFTYGIHVPVDTLRNWVVSGLSDPIGSWDAETERQFRLARHAAVQMAVTYAAADFAVVIDDVIEPEHLQMHYAPHFGEYVPYSIMLLPSAAVALRRNAQREKVFDTTRLNELIPAVQGYLSQYDLVELGWHVIDNSDLSIEETVLEIMARVAHIP
jgi:tRNA uridine 5-carbamoylmethylation protein Kti12